MFRPGLPVQYWSQQYINVRSTLKSNRLLTRLPLFSPQFKRLAAFQGDFIFQAPRRFFLEAASKTQNAWSYRELLFLAILVTTDSWFFCIVYKRGKSTPELGSFHGSDQTEWFFENSSISDTVGIDYLSEFWIFHIINMAIFNLGPPSFSIVHFINTLDPNVPAVQSDSASSGSTGLFWPQWANSSALLTFSDPTVVNITSDTYRSAAFGLLNQLSKEFVNSPEVFW